MKINIESYKEMLNQPWGKIQYEITFAQLEHLKNKVILDFGSGVGIVSQYLSQNNKVISVEPNEEMLNFNKTTSYKKILGSLDVLKKFKEKTFDIIICHNVFEYIAPENRKEYIEQFERILNDGGKLSIIKHNQVGKVLQSVVFSNDVDKAIKLLNTNEFETSSFSNGSTYTIKELMNITNLTLENYLGIRSFYSLQPNQFKNENGWLENMTKMELLVCDLKPYKDISFFQHIWLKK